MRPLPPMSDEALTEDRRVIPFPRRLIGEPSPQDQPTATASRAAHGDTGGEVRCGSESRTEALVRHYLKFMLPSIPITMFVVGFIYCSLLVGAHTTASAAPPAHATTRPAYADSALPLLGASLLALSSTLLCVVIYLGYLRVITATAAREG